MLIWIGGLSKIITVSKKSVLKVTLKAHTRSGDSYIEIYLRID